MRVRLLVLGGGGFLGYHVVDAARGAGHQVTVFSRSSRSDFADVNVIQGDRRAELSGLRGRQWDGVLDTFTDLEPGAPAVRATADLLSGAVAVYGYVSGMSVYAPHGPRRPDESAPVRRAGVQPDDDPLQERSLAKLAAEQVLQERFAGEVFLPRVGIMVGPRDPSHRFTYWPQRMAGALAGRRDRAVLAPGDPARAVQYTDARDLATWFVSMLAAARGGVFNAVGPGRPDSLAEVLDACLRAAGGRPGDIDFIWGGEDFLRERLSAVEEERRPLWYPEDQIPQEAIDSAAALAAGLTFRSAESTAHDTLAGAATNRGNDGLDTDSFAALERTLRGSWAKRRAARPSGSS